MRSGETRMFQRTSLFPVTLRKKRALFSLRVGRIGGRGFIMGILFGRALEQTLYRERPCAQQDLAFEDFALGGSFAKEPSGDSGNVQ